MKSMGQKILIGIVVLAAIVSVWWFVFPKETSEPSVQENHACQEQNEPVRQVVSHEALLLPSPDRPGVQIPAYLTVPSEDQKEGPLPLVLMLHGYGSNHNESGGFDAISEGLAQQGMIVVTLDFPGCGRSTEAFSENTMTNMKSDVLAVLKEVCERYTIDESHMGALGYSLGGRILLELTTEHRIELTAMELVAPAEDVNDFKTMFGGPESWDDLKETAYQTGTANYCGQELKAEWFRDLEAYPDLAERAAEVYDGSALVVWSSDDRVVQPTVSQETAEALGAHTLIIHSNGHGYSFHGADPDAEAQVNGASLAYFTRELQTQR